MEEYLFFEGKLPSAYRFNFEQALFNTEEYRLLQSSNNWISFYILNEVDFLVEGQIHFYLKDGTAKSVIQSPFGGLEVSEKVNNKALFQFIEFFCLKLSELACKSVVIFDRPILYGNARQSLSGTFLQNLGFSVSTAEVGSIISVSSKTFADSIHPRKKKKLNQSLGMNLQFRTLGPDALADVYHFILSHRTEKKYVLSVSLEHLSKSVQRLPQAYLLFGVFDDGKMVAASVVVRVSEKILYHFISDHVRKVREARPALVLMQGIYNYCQENKFEKLDLGTSTLNGLPNFKLIRFKTELAGEPTQKLTFTKMLS